MTLIDLPAGLDISALRTLAGGPKQTSEAAALPDGKVPAISYLRVSTKDQATRNGLEEGLSIPAQRDAAQRKADQLNAVIVAEFIEPGESGKTARRKALQEMLDYSPSTPSGTASSTRSTASPATGSMTRSSTPPSARPGSRSCPSW